ncbi:arylsulfatase B [Anabrus simplex]|uniref:arylsulfatase B n=1 Tax=Anabrus simplex TaxID=316456 RepID=UPI0035A35F21
MIEFFALMMVMMVMSQIDAIPRRNKQPHIIYIIADDMGWNDVSFHGSNQIPTPNIDALAFNGIILNSHYVQAICTPSRAALMTGKYPIHTGMQGIPILAAEPRGLPEGKILPQYLKDLGYATHAIGKWHLGYHTVNYTPTYRGFDSHLGYFNGFVSYYDYILQARSNMSGFDMRRNLTTAWDLAGRYATDLFTDHAIDIINHHNPKQPLFIFLAHLAVHAGNPGKLLEAPQEVIDRFRYIKEPNRRTYAAMVAKLDESVGRVVRALQKRGMLQDSIIVFLADNGAPTVGIYPNWGSNYPFRGVKETLWEGGVRGVALLWSANLQNVPRVSNQLMHITDWLPTLYSAAGGNGQSLEKKMDGLDLWSNLVYNRTSRRNSVLLNIDERTKNSAIRLRHWKLIIGTVSNGTMDDFFGDSGDAPEVPPYDPVAVVKSSAGQAIAAVQGRKVTPVRAISFLRKQATVKCIGTSSSNCWPRPGQSCLFDLQSDPCEHKDVSNRYPLIADQLRREIVRFAKDFQEQINQPEDLEGADPARWNYTWSPWIDCQWDDQFEYCNTATYYSKRSHAYLHYQ